MRTLRVGFPYSVFAERTGPGRVPYFGPFEDDIMHALDYALPDTPGTAGLAEPLRYAKTSGGSSGMRSAYDAARGLEIARRYPENVRLAVSRKTSSVRDTRKGVRHFLNTRGFTPIRVTDPDRYRLLDRQVRSLVDETLLAKREHDREKIRKRAGLSA